MLIYMKKTIELVDSSASLCKSQEKKEFRETIRYFANQIDETGVKLHLETEANFDLLSEYDEVVMASGVEPRKVKIEGVESPEKVIDYQTLIKRSLRRRKSSDCQALVVLVLMWLPC